MQSPSPIRISKCNIYKFLVEMSTLHIFFFFFTQEGSMQMGLYADRQEQSPEQQGEGMNLAPRGCPEI